MVKIAKFGGSSLSNYHQWEKVKNIVDKDESIKVVVVSAIGKDKLNTSKLTDLLILLNTHIELGIDFETLFKEIHSKFKEICISLNLQLDIDVELETFRKKLSTSLSKDFIVSRGEFFTAKMMSEYLGYTFIDSSACVFLNLNGEVDYDKTNQKIQELLQNNSCIILPGFYGSTPSGKIRLFSRGGSDLTGSIVANALNVNLYENWTDVDGLFVANPNIIKNPEVIKNITYRELRELSYRGANVIHEGTIIPLVHKDIPIQIKNTDNLEAEGTTISSEFQSNGSYMTGIAGKKDYTSFNVVKRSSVSKIKVLTDVLNVFYKYKVNIENIPSGIDSFSVIVETNQLKSCSFDLLNELHNISEITDVKYEDQLALIAIVGRNMANIPGVAGKLFTTLGNKGINIKIIAQASAELSIIFGVSNEDYDAAIKVIYNDFYLERKL